MARQTKKNADGAAQGNRREDVLERAGELMAAKGYDGTSMRDIASAVGMLPGSLYYHFPSKEALFLALHQRVVSEMAERVTEALDGVQDSWDRLEAASRAHLEGLLFTGNLVAIVSPEFLGERHEICDAIRAERRSYENLFRDLVAALPLPDGIDRRLLRLHLFGALNWTPTWYEENKGASPADIAHQILSVFRRAFEGRA